MQVPEGFEQHYPGKVLLLLQQTVCGLKQAARALWQELTAMPKDMRYSK